MKLNLSTDAKFNEWLESASFDELKREGQVLELYLIGFSPETEDDEKLADAVELRLESIKYQMGDFEFPMEDEDEN